MILNPSILGFSCWFCDSTLSFSDLNARRARRIDNGLDPSWERALSGDVLKEKDFSKRGSMYEMSDLWKEFKSWTLNFENWWMIQGALFTPKRFHTKNDKNPMTGKIDDSSMTKGCSWGSKKSSLTFHFYHSKTNTLITNFFRMFFFD